MTEPGLNIGIVGAGGFARFALAAFMDVPGIRPVAVTDIDPVAAGNMGQALGIAVYPDLAALLAEDHIDLVYIATPPDQHYAQSRQSLLAGKHVICEKPAALRTAEALELAAIARAGQILYAVNLMQRYNPLFGSVKKMMEGKLLGNFLHGYFENYASDEFLKADHWFWDQSKSGGIFIEHGVHFFDLFEGWLGEGRVVNALEMRRPRAAAITDRVQATVLYEEGSVNYYHGFDQPKVLDRQEMRLQFGRGEITLHGWVPVSIQVHGLFRTGDITALKYIMKDFSEMQVTDHGEEAGNHHLTIRYENRSGKQELYRQMLSEMIRDQWNWIRDRRHRRVMDDLNAIRSLSVAEQATQMAQKF
jgi:predicted dehydrogenase